MEDSHPAVFFLTVFVSLLVGFFIGLCVVAENVKDTSARALSCMANGNTIQQCETVLGLPVTK